MRKIFISAMAIVLAVSAVRASSSTNTVTNAVTNVYTNIFVNGINQR